MTYGCQIWGPDFAVLDPKKAFGNPFQVLQSTFMRFVTGASKCVKVQILLDECDQLPIQCTWVRVFSRFWNYLTDSPAGSLTRSVFCDNIRLACLGCTACWASRVIHLVKAVGQTMPTDCSVLICTPLAPDALAASVKAKLYDYTVLDIDPRTAPSDKVTLCTYNQWFRNNKPAPHLDCINIPIHHHINLMRFRLGCADLATIRGRRARTNDRVSRSARVCTIPGCGGVEDELHAIFECKCCADLRCSPSFSCLFDGVNHGDMRKFFDNHRQHILAKFVTAIATRRSQALVALKCAQHRVIAQ